MKIHCVIKVEISNFIMAEDSMILFSEYIQKVYLERQMLLLCFYKARNNTVQYFIMEIGNLSLLQLA